VAVPNLEPSMLRLRTEDVDWQPQRDGIVVLDRRHMTYLRVNRTGALIWHALAEGTTHVALVDLLQTRFELQRSQAIADTREFLRLLRDHELLIVSA
jgi:hypothetical protein